MQLSVTQKPALVQLAIALWLSAGSVSHGQSHSAGVEDYGASAVVAKPVASTNREDATASGTELDLRDRPKALESISEALQRVPGVRLRQLGGFGSFSGLSLRGAELAQTSVLLGNLPLTSVDQGAFDFSLWPMPLFDRVVVYRGGAPAWLGDGAIGGVVQLQPTQAEQRTTSASIGYGSFGRFRVSAHSALGGHPRELSHDEFNSSDTSTTPGTRLVAHVSVDGADNDFTFRDTQATELTRADDRTARVRNGQIIQGSGLAHLQVPILGGQLETVVLGLARSSGIPGPQTRPSPDASKRLLQVQTMAGYTQERANDEKGRQRFQVLIGAGHQATQVTDLEAQIGTTYPAQTDDRWTHLQARVAGTWPLVPWLETTLVGSARLDLYRPENPLAFSAPPRPSQRTSAAVTAELRAHGKPLGLASELRLSGRGAWNRGQIRSIRLASEPGQKVSQFAPNVRLAAAVAPAHFLTLSASLSNGRRAPSIRELFGDRAFLLENPTLQPEQALTVDAGVALCGQLGDWVVSGEARGFVLRVDDFITYVRTSQNTSRAENLGYGRIAGAEAGLQLDYDRYGSFSFAATALTSRSPSGAQLPYRPPLVMHSQLSGHLYPSHLVERVTLFSDFEFISHNYTDDKGISAILGRLWLGAGASISLSKNLSAQFRASNLFDHRSKDLNGFWLPGRTLFASMTFEEPL